MANLVAAVSAQLPSLVSSAVADLNRGAVANHHRVAPPDATPDTSPSGELSLGHESDQDQAAREGLVECCIA